MKKTMWYTLVIVCPDEGQTFTEYVEAESVTEAVTLFWKGPPGIKPSNAGIAYYVAQVFEGKLRPCVSDWWIGNPRVWRGD